MSTVQKLTFKITKLDHAKQLIRSEVQKETDFITKLSGGKICTDSRADAIKAAKERISTWRQTLIWLSDVTEV